MAHGEYPTQTLQNAASRQYLGMMANRQRQLRDTLETLLHELESAESELARTRAVRANGADDDEHDPDGIPLSAVLEELEWQRLRLGAQIREAQRALDDVAQGRYGSCQSCSRPIPEARLDIKPTARTCVMCAS